MSKERVTHPHDNWSVCLSFRVPKEYQKKMDLICQLNKCTKKDWLLSKINYDLERYDNRSDDIKALLAFKDTFTFLKYYTILDSDKKRGKKVLNSLNEFEQYISKLITNLP